MSKPLTLVASFEKFPGLPPRSTERLKYERFMHYFHYPYIIHPYSRFRYYWDCLMCCSIFLHVLLSSSRKTKALIHGSIYYHNLLLGFQIHGLLDIMLNFFTGFAEKTNKTVTLDPSKIVSKYLRTWFVIDLLSILPYESISYYLPDCYFDEPRYFELFDCHFYADVFSFEFLLRIFCFQRYFNRIVLLSMINAFRAQMFSYSFCLLSIFSAFVHMNLYAVFYNRFSNSTWIGVSPTFCFGDTPSLSPNAHIEPCQAFYLSRVNLVLSSTLSLLEEHLIYSKDLDPPNIVLRIFFYYFSVIGLTAFVAFLINFAVSSKSTRERYYEKDRDVRSYLRKKPFTKAIREKVLYYFQVFFEKNVYEDEMFEFLPESELERITISFTLPTIQKNKLFADLPKEIVKKIAYVTHDEIYLPHDVLVRAGDIGRSMILIKFGTVAIYSRKFVKLTELDDGDYFGAKSIIFPVKILNSSAVASKTCSVCRLDRDDFLDIMQSYPRYLDYLQRQLLAEKEMRN